MVGEPGVVTIGTGLSATDAMNVVAAAEFENIVLAGEALYMASSGVGTVVDTILETYGEDAEWIAGGAWEYYKRRIVGTPNSAVKAWLRWNGIEFDAYLRCEQGAGDAGFSSHGSPYIGPDGGPHG